MDELLLFKEIETPPVGAGPLSVTVPTDGLPRRTVVGFNDSDDNATGVTVSATVLLTLL